MLVLLLVKEIRPHPDAGSVVAPTCTDRAAKPTPAAAHSARSTNSPADSQHEAGGSNPWPLPKLTPESQTALHQLITFAQTGEVVEAKHLDPAQLRKLADAVAHSPDTGSLSSSLAYSFGMPQSLIPTEPGKMSDFLMGWFQAVGGESPSPPHAPAATSGASYSPTPIAFADRTDPHGQITSSADAFVSTTDTLYGVFENQGSSAGTSYVTAVWRNNDLGTVVHQGTESVFKDAPSNYVWLRLPQGWSPGQWQLDIYDPGNNFAPIASGTFTMK